LPSKASKEFLVNAAHHPCLQGLQTSRSGFEIIWNHAPLPVRDYVRTSDEMEYEFRTKSAQSCRALMAQVPRGGKSNKTGL
jgi:hypothetical protein